MAQANLHMVAMALSKSNNPCCLEVLALSRPVQICNFLWSAVGRSRADRSFA